MNGVVRQMQHRVRVVCTSLDNAGTEPSQRLVLLYRLVEIVHSAGLQQYCQRYRVLDCKVSALAVMGKHSVRGIAHQYNAAALPGPQWAYFE